MTHGPMVRLAKAVLWVQGGGGLGAHLEQEQALNGLAGPCGTCPRSCGSVEDTEGEWHLCPTCDGTGTDPLAKAREADLSAEIAAALLAAIEGLMEIAQIAMPDTYFASDSRVAKARVAIAKATGERSKAREADLSAEIAAAHPDPDR